MKVRVRDYASPVPRDIASDVRLDAPRSMATKPTKRLGRPRLRDGSHLNGA
jgi:hypothetical protein